MRDKRTIFVLLGLFLVIYAAVLLYTDHIVWDSAVYIGMGKYLYSGGDAGLYELTRPVLLPFMIGFLWKAGMDALLAAKLLTLVFVAGTGLLTYLLASEIFGRRTAILSVILLAVTPLFFKYSTLPLTGIPAAFLILGSALLLVRGSYFMAGLAAGLGFVMRFPAGLMLLVCGILLLTHRHPLKDLLRFGTVVLLGFSLVGGAYLLSNMYLFSDDYPTLQEAAFRPLQRAAWHQAQPAETIRGDTLYSWIADQLYYPVGLLWDNPLLAFSLVAVFFLAQQRPRNTATVLVPLLVFLLYFTYISNKQLRFALLFLPFLSILSAFGILSLRKWFQHRPAKSVFTTALVAFGVILVILLPIRAMPLFYYVERADFGPELNDALQERGISGPVMATDPLPAAYIENRIFFYGFSPAEALKKFELQFDGDTLIYNPKAFWCSSADKDCEQDKETVLRHLLHTHNTIFYGTYFGHEYYAFSKNHSIKPIDKDMLPEDIPVSLAKNPRGTRSLVVFRVDHAFSIFRDDGSNSLWHPERMEKTIGIFRERPATFAVIPKDLMEMPEGNFSFVKYSLAAMPDVEVAQLGYSHEDKGGSSEFSGISYNNQRNDIEKGLSFIEDKLSTDVTTFIPPFNNADRNTLKVLEDLGYRVFSSTPGNLLPPSDEVVRIDLDLSFLEWTEGRSRPMTLDELKAEFDHFYSYRDHIILSVSYTTYPDMDALLSLVAHIEGRDVTLVNLRSLGEWLRFRDEVKLLAGKDSLKISVPAGADHVDGLTLAFEQSGEYTMESDYTGDLYLSNNNVNDLTVCLNGACHVLAPHEARLYEGD
jgi:hypothetical protein